MTMLKRIKEQKRKEKRDAKESAKRERLALKKQQPDLKDDQVIKELHHD